MATRTRAAWKRRPDGQFDCRVGWKTTSGGKRDQHKFRLGTDEKEARRRDLLLRQIWERVEELQPVDPSWTPDSLDVAKLVAQGDRVIEIKRSPGEEDVDYAHRVHSLRILFPMLSIYTEREYGPALGVQILGALKQMDDDAEGGVEKQQQQARSQFLALVQGSPRPDGGPTLHEALRAYSDWLDEEYEHPEANISPWGHTQKKQVETLLSHHNDLPLGRLDRNQVEQMLRYWRKRPYRKVVKQKETTKKRVTRASASNYVKALRKFFTWLHACDKFDWTKPGDLDQLRTKIETLDGEVRRQVTPEQLFTLDELVQLYRYGTPLDRLLILLGLNCGFGAAEAATLCVEELWLWTPHSKRHQEILNFTSTKEDSFIKRPRRKTGVYGEFLLFEHTVRGIEWALQRRKKQPDYKSQSRLLLNSNDAPYDRPTKSGNASQQIPNLFRRLLDRIEVDETSISRLPFKMLRKTGGDLVKRFSDGEIKGVFLCHGHPVESDDLDDVYTSRSFGKVFHALRDVEQYLEPMFAAAGPEPFRPQPQAYTSRKTHERILELHQENIAPEAIAKQVGRSPGTIQRHITRSTGPRRRGRPKNAR